MKRHTPHDQLQRLYTTADGRTQAHGGWKKFPLFWFILFLSYKCTRRCPYCYAFNQVGDDNTLEMNEDTFARLLDWIPEVWELNQIKVNLINFLGGEPLLRTDRIRQVMDAVNRRTGGMQGLVNTNGDLVDSVNWDDLAAIQWMTMNITDLSLEELGRRMAIIRERSNVVGQTIAMTLDEENLDRILEVSTFGIENGYRLRYNKNMFEGKNADYKARLLKKYHELCDLLEGYATRGFDVHTTFMLDFLIPLWDREDSPYPCGKRIAVVFPDGSVGPCIRDHEFKNGTIFDPHPLDVVTCETFQYDVNKPDVPDECRECDVRTACQGGCPRDRLLLSGNRAGKSVFCDIHRQIIPRLRHLEALKSASR
ncbi:SPASM domain-containing protein [Desulfosarcina sp. OttesenSCG-928-A07]|nr:SPASM domain-containing protein [Desulfosarcina sp. OttesenSCG-928-G17]MDL2329964.1 SPASM domain-containing protein [Desulfosarcina sp. OttesenSCG-928-A07]